MARVRKALVVSTIAVLLIAAITGAGFAWLRYAPRRTPVGQAQLAQLDAASLGAFRDAFNAASAERRVLLLLSPT